MNFISPSIVRRPLSVILVAYRGERWLPECLATLLAASRDRLRLILVDNGGNGSAVPAACPDFDYRVLRTERSLGFSEANNLALGHVDLSDGLVCFLNQDTRSGPGWLDACRERFAADAKLGAVVPLTRTYDDAAWDQGFLACSRANAELAAALDGINASNELEEVHEAGDRVPRLCQPCGVDLASCTADTAVAPFDAASRTADTAVAPYSDSRLAAWYEVPFVPAAAMVARAEALLAAGPFDPVFGSYYEDYDLCRRIRAAGYRVGVATGGRVLHFDGSASSTPAARRRRQRLVLRNRAIHRIREAGPRRLAAVARCFAGQFPHSLCRSLARTKSSQPLSTLLAAHWQLLPLLGRLLSERRDRAAWRTYLKQIGWPELSAVEQDTAEGDTESRRDEPCGWQVSAAASTVAASGQP